MSDPFSTDANAFLAGGAPGMKFPAEGHTDGGTIMSWEMAQKTDLETGEPKFWQDGKPVMQLVITLQAEATGFKYEGNSYKKVAIPDDDGVRRLYVSGNLRNAVAAALKKAGGKLEAGAYLEVTRGTDIAPTKKGYSGRHTFTAVWTPASQNARAGEDFLAGDDSEDGEPKNPF